MGWGRRGGFERMRADVRADPAEAFLTITGTFPKAFSPEGVVGPEASAATVRRGRRDARRETPVVRYE